MIRSLKIFSSLACLCLTALTAHAQIDRLALPQRSPTAMTGLQFRDNVTSLSLADRERAVYQQVMTGNVPDFLRQLIPISVTQTLNGQPRSATWYVTPDYLAVGSADNYFRMPMSPRLAQWIADGTSTTLPTSKMVDAIWQQAPYRLVPSPLTPDATMITVPVFWQHQLLVQSQRQTAGHTDGTLLAGHKKDVVISPRLHDPATSGRVAIYGWHQANGSPIQPVYLGHAETWVDYSHGIRLVGTSMLLDGTTVTVNDVLTSSAVQSLLNKEPQTYSTTAPPRYNAGSPPPIEGANVGDWPAY